MPVKRRAGKRRLDAAAEAEAWECYFDSGYDFFADLPKIGVETDAHSRPDPDAGEAAWHRLGALFLAVRTPDPHKEPWALRTFGEPQCQ
jgi:hypothetical protein